LREDVRMILAKNKPSTQQNQAAAG